MPINENALLMLRAEMEIINKIFFPIDALLDDRDTSEESYNSLYQEWKRQIIEGHTEIINRVLRTIYEEYFFNPDKRMITTARWHYLECREEYELKKNVTSLIEMRLDNSIYSEMLEGKDLEEVLNQFVFLVANHYHYKEFFMKIVMKAIAGGYQTDWNELYNRVWPVILHAPRDYDRVRIEYHCFLMAIIMIKKDECLSDEAKEMLLRELENAKNWRIMAYLYSVMTGLIIGSEYNNFLQVINHFTDKYRVYAHLMARAVNYRPTVLETNNETKKEKCRAAREKLTNATKEEKANHDLDLLYNAIFPKAVLESCSRVTNRLTEAETQKRLEDQQRLINEQMELINNQKIEIGELRLYREVANKLTKTYDGDAISLEDLKQAIDAIKDPDKAQQFYFQLNYILRKNPTWRKHQDEFADFIEKKMSGEGRDVTTIINAEKLEMKNNVVAKQEINVEGAVGQFVAHADKIVNK